jgi:hypothetical protein
MKRAILSAILGMTLAISSTALPGAANAQSTVKLNMDDNHVIKESVLTNSKIPHAKAGSFEVGDIAPSDVTLQEFPAEVTSRVPAVKGHSFFIAGDEVVVVSTSDKKVADVIK